MDTPVAILEAIADHPERGRFPIKLMIGAPYLSNREPDTWRCAVTIEPLHPHLRDIAGGDAFQALCLASRLAVELLDSFIKEGGRLTYDGKEDVPLDAYIPLPPKP